MNHGSLVDETSVRDLNNNQKYLSIRILFVNIIAIIVSFFSSQQKKGFIFKFFP